MRRTVAFRIALCKGSFTTLRVAYQSNLDLDYFFMGRYVELFRSFEHLNIITGRSPLKLRNNLGSLLQKSTVLTYLSIRASFRGLELST